MRTITDTDSFERLISRLVAVQPDTARHWGTMTAAEMLCHLGDATASVLDRGASESAPASASGSRSRPVLKWIALKSPLPWPKEKLNTPPNVDPHAGGTRPGDFEADRRRAIEGLRAFVSAAPGALARSHGVFGSMTRRDWHRWAYRHTDHHLRQFGL